MRKLIVAVVLLVAMTACKGQMDMSLSAGNHKITKEMRGFWSAPNAEQGCKWTVSTSKKATGKAVVLSGKWKLGNETQTVILGTGNVGMYFWPNDKCGTWHN